MAAEEKSINRCLYKITIEALKVTPMLLAFCDVSNMVFDCFGIDTSVFSLLGGISIIPLAFIYLASYVFKFCVYHRMFLHYVLVNNILILVDYYVGIPVTDKMMFMIHLVLIGIFLFLILYFYRKERCCKQ